MLGLGPQVQIEILIKAFGSGEKYEKVVCSSVYCIFSYNFEVMANCSGAINALNLQWWAARCTYAQTSSEL